MVKPHIPPDHTDPFLTTREAALVLGVTLRSVQNYVERGDLHSGRTPGGHRRIRTSDVHALAQKMGIKTPEPAASPLQALKAAPAVMPGSCDTCEHGDTTSLHPPCMECCVVMAGKTNRWEPKKLLPDLARANPVPPGSAPMPPLDWAGLAAHLMPDLARERDSLRAEVEQLRARLAVPDQLDVDQDWSTVDGAAAWHLIDRHGEGWGHIGVLMSAWRDAHPDLARLRAEIGRLRLSLRLICADVERLDMALDPDDWAGDECMTDITARALARLDAIGVRSAGQEGGAA